MSCLACGSDHLETLPLREAYQVRVLERVVETGFCLCTVCGLLMQSDPLDDASLARYYAENLQLRSTEVNAIERAVFAQQAAFMQRHRPLTGAAVLELGADTGQFLTHLADTHGMRTYFSELNTTARELLAVRHTQADAQTCDFIVARHVLEHVATPLAWLTSLRSQLAKGGCLFIEVPDWSTLDAHTDGLNFEHISYFSQLALTTLLTRAGFGVTACESAVNRNYPTTGNRVLRVLAAPAPTRSAQIVRHIESTRAPYRAIEMLARSFGSPPKLALYGASWLTEEALRHTQLDASTVLAIFDKDPRKHAMSFSGIGVRPPSDVLALAPAVIVILSSYEAQIREDLTALGYQGRVLGLGPIIREVTSSDRQGVVALVAEVLSEFDLRFGEGSATDAQLHALPESYAGGCFWVATEVDGALLGTCGVFPIDATTFELRKMYLHRDARGRGVGKRLLDVAVDWVRARGGNKLVLDTVEEMTRAISFYQANGFVRDDAQIRGSRCTRGYARFLDT